LAWLLITGRAETVEAAEAILRARRPHVVLSQAHRAVLVELVAVDQKELV
jgi:protein-tyrosine phosphatase